MTLRIIVADDELLARKRLVRLLAEIEDVDVVGECADAEAVLTRAAEGGVDLVLLDIHMPGLTGIDAMTLLPADGPDVVFCTAHPDYAIKAFDGGAVDYLLKPIEVSRLRKAIERVRERHSHKPKTTEERTGLQRLAVSTKQGIVLVDPDNITHAFLDGVLVTLVTTDAEYLTDFTLQELEKRLPRDGFVRVHRRALLNLAHVARLEPVESGGFVARTRRGHTVDVSRQAARALRKSLGLRKPAEDDADEP